MRTVVAAMIAVALVSGFKLDPSGNDWYGHNGPCNSNDVTVIKITERGNAIERWGPQGCDPTLPMTGTN